MRAWVVDRRSVEFDCLSIKNVDRPSPGPGEILVRVCAVSINPCLASYFVLPLTCFQPGDYQAILDQWRIHSSFPWIPGVDAAGNVVQLGEDVPEGKWGIGDRVMFFQNLYGEHGTFAEFTVVQASAVALIPSSMSFEQACTIPCAGYTSYLSIVERMRPGPGDSILIHGASGGTGSFAVQFAKRLCQVSTVYARCDQIHFDFVRSLGADICLNSSEPLTKGQITVPGGLGFAFNNISSRSATLDLSLVNDGGMVACIAGRPNWSSVPEFTKSLSVHDVYLGSAYRFSERIGRFGEMGSEIIGMWDEGKLTLEPALVGNLWNDLVSFLKRLEERHDSRRKVRPGKFVLTC